MWRVWQVVAFFALLTAAARGGEWSWQLLSIQKSVFSPDLGMLDSEREEYAAQLTDHATARLAAGKGSPASLLEARKVLGLALNLSPRNKQAMVLNFQLAKGVLPESSASSTNSEVLAKLLFARAQQLEKQGGDENLKLARIFTQLAAEMDPKDVDVVYASEINRLDHGPVDWNALVPTQPLNHGDGN